MGRPLKKLDEERIAQLAYEGANNMQIATLVGCGESTIRERFRDLVRKKRAERKNKLKKLQMECAESKNPTMLIWLGKQELDQTDKHDVKSDGKVEVVIRYVDHKEPSPDQSWEGQDDAIHD